MQTECGVISKHTVRSSIHYYVKIMTLLSFYEII